MAIENIKKNQKGILLKEEKNDELFIAYHVHTYYDNPSGNRQMYINKIYFDGDAIKATAPTIKEKGE